MSSTSIGPSRIEIWKMFNTISSTYDKTNRWMTAGLDMYWRKKVASFIPKGINCSVLDCATGTADQLISLMQSRPSIIKAVGIDLSEEMLRLGHEKVKKTPFSKQVDLQVASALEIPFPENSFDYVTMSFGIRNVTNVEKALQEIHRVLRPGGTVFILETSIPKNFMIKKLHLFYLRKVLPFVGGIISKKKEAYQYLNQTTETFLSSEQFCSQMNQVGLCDATCHPLTWGTVSIYKADKPL